jgi:hypothetical protein
VPPDRIEEHYRNRTTPKSTSSRRYRGGGVLPALVPRRQDDHAADGGRYPLCALDVVLRMLDAARAGPIVRRGA